MGVELNAKQCVRVDEVYEAVWEMCKVLTENPDLPWNMEFLGPIAEDVSETLTNYGFRVYFPAIVYDADKDEEYISEYYEKED